MEYRDSLASEIIREEERLAALRAEIAERTCRLTTLREELASFSHEPTRWITLAERSTAAPTTNAAKVMLFRSLFRGRDDVFPRRWENLRKGTSGYSPACANEWSFGVCAKKRGLDLGRRTTCSNCPNQAFIPVSDEEIAKHLRGDQIIGAYPLLADETCWFLAADFDRETWQEDIVSFVQTCNSFGLRVAIERSRSGAGAHAWFFFSSPVPATLARELGCFLVTETMARRHQLSMASYDRLFPNQDTMPKGGFGNLIALPLQRHARAQGNSVFVDESLQPWADQWAFLAGIQRLEPAVVKTLVDEASKQGRVIGARLVDAACQDDETPWARLPSGQPRRLVIAEPLPRVVHAVLSQRLFLEKVGLPSPLLNQLKRLAAFQNPEFLKRQGMRLSIALTPRVITCAEDFPNHVALPRGCLGEADALLKQHGVGLEVEDEREDGTHLDLFFRGMLTPLQQRAAEALLAHDTGVLVAPPGSGKTVIGTYLVAARNRSTLILVHRNPLLDQWIAQLSLFLGVDPKDIGQIHAGKWKPNGRLDVAMVQSLVRKGGVHDIVAGYGHVIQDEAHHAPAVSFERILSEVKARYVVGLTATPLRRDGQHPIIPMQLGAVRHKFDARSQAALQPFAHTLIVRDTGFQPGPLVDSVGIQELYAALARDHRRNTLIVNDVVAAIREGRSPIVLTERREHLEHFLERLRNAARHLIILHGGMRSRERRETFARLALIPDGEERLLIATGRYIGEGFDDPRLDTLFLALPVSWKGTLIQYAGRLHRIHPRKTEVRIYDYVDRAVPMLMKMFQRRLRGYRAIGYARHEAPLGLHLIDSEPVLEYGKDTTTYLHEES